MFREKKAYGQDPSVVVRSKPHTFNLPFRLSESVRVFTCSWSDFFIREADSWRDEAWAIIDRTRHLTYQILTKRIERVATRLPWGDGKPWPHVQILVSVENQKQADRRLPKLLAINAAVRGVSYEPALGPVDFRTYIEFSASCPNCGDGSYIEGPCRGCDEGHYRENPTLDWIIVGGESGPGARPFDLVWARNTIRQCRAAGVPVFVKQLGSLFVTSYYDDEYRAVYEEKGLDWPDPIDWDISFGQPPLSSRVRITLRDRKGGDWTEWPTDLRIREFPDHA